MTISTHVLDAVAGGPAVGVPIVLEFRDDNTWTHLDAARTDADGRVTDLSASPGVGVYRLHFDIEAHLGADTFYPEVVVVFRIVDAARHHHVPLLLSPYAYSTYRGS